MKSITRPFIYLGEISTKLTRGQPLPCVLAHKPLCHKIKRSDFSYTALGHMGFSQSKVEFGDMRSYSNYQRLWLVLSPINGLSPHIQLYRKQWSILTELRLVISWSSPGTWVWVLFCSMILSADLSYGCFIPLGSWLEGGRVLVIHLNSSKYRLNLLNNSLLRSHAK